MRHKWEESAVWFKRFLGNISLVLVAWHAFFMHNPGGAGLYLPFNAWGWIFASLVMALGLWYVTLSQRLVVSPLLTAQWLGDLVVAAHGLSGIRAQGLCHSPAAGAVCRPAVSGKPLSVAIRYARRETGCSICCWGPSPLRRCSAWCSITCWCRATGLGMTPRPTAPMASSSNPT